jgi:hypothetical protein
MRHHSNLVKARCQVIGRCVKNNSNEHLGKVKEIVLDKITGQPAYVVLENGAFLCMGGKLFALPWDVFHYDDSKDCFIVNISKDRLNSSAGFDKNNWPGGADRSFIKS